MSDKVAQLCCVSEMGLTVCAGFQQLIQQGSVEPIVHSLMDSVLVFMQRNQAIEEIHEDIYQLKVGLETLKQYHQDDEDDDEKGDEGKDAKPANDTG